MNILIQNLKLLDTTQRFIKFAFQTIKFGYQTLLLYNIINEAQ